MIAYHIPESASPDYYPLRVLQTILSAGQSSRLYKRLVDKDQSALFVQGNFGFAFDPTLFTVAAQPKAGVQPEAVEKAIYEELDRIKDQGVGADEIQKAKNILLADFYREMKTINGKANTIGSYEVFFGDYQKLFTAADEYNKVTAEAVRAIAKKYFSDKNRTVATLVPEAPAAAPAPGGAKE
jgi:predicted Zn-dependent peptidase